MMEITSSQDEVHVWHVPLDELHRDVSRLWQLLSHDERARADRYQFEQDRQDFCVSRGVLRLLLQAYGAGRAADITLAYSRHGKPRLARTDNEPLGEPLEFNVAHTRGMAVYAFSRSRGVGVDVERVREVADADRIVARHFAAEERAQYQALPRSLRQRGFFNAWTRKEAIIKATGMGLSGSLDTFAVVLTPGASVRLLESTSQPAAAAAWSLADMTIDPCYVVAAAAEGRGVRMKNQILSERSVP